ncbi:MAG: hypothetical protein J5685_11165 [Clostridiales bacterium]|nr:hypothetical protein [Clostridiales bacterium]
MLLTAIFIALVVGICFGYSLGAVATFKKVNKENNMGDCKNSFRDFAESDITIISKKDNVAYSELENFKRQYHDTGMI